MSNWWNNLYLVQQIFYIIAIPSTIILLIQTILTVLGLGTDTVDLDLDLETDIDSDITNVAGFKFFSIQGMVAFFTIFGWSGVTLTQTKIPLVIILIISLAAGIFAMFIIALLLFGMSKLQYNGTLDLKNAIGLTGKVYIPIPKNASGVGKIQITVQERLIETEAITNLDTDLSTGTFVRVIDITDDNIMIIEKVSES